MRLFTHYAPSMIAKHITRLFKGNIYINDIGKFEFDNGKLILPSCADTRHYQAVNEINQEVKKLRCPVSN